MVADSNIYRGSAREARWNGTLNLWRESLEANILCAKGIDCALVLFRNDPETARRLTDTHGFKRVAWVLANTVQTRAKDGDFSEAGQAWARRTHFADTKYNRAYYVVPSPAAALEELIQKVQSLYQSYDLFEHTHCVQESGQDYTGKVLVMSPDVLRESCWSQENQLWLATGGFGCDPHASGRAVFATCLGDGERAQLLRTDFTGVLQDQYLPDWAEQKLKELGCPQERQKPGGMTMG